MSRLVRISLLAALAPAALCGHAWGDAPVTGSVGCSALAQAAANGMTARVSGDDTTIKQPTSVTRLTCLDNFFKGTGLNMVTNLLDPSSLLDAVEGKLCALVASTWTSLLGSAQCGLTLTGFDLGFGGIGGGLACPKLSFGGSGPPIASVGIGAGGAGSGLYINGAGMLPAGYSASGIPVGSF